MKRNLPHVDFSPEFVHKSGDVPGSKLPATPERPITDSLPELNW
jgi:hypothetical protein